MTVQVSRPILPPPPPYRWDAQNEMEFRAAVLRALEDLTTAVRDLQAQIDAAAAP